MHDNPVFVRCVQTSRRTLRHRLLSPFAILYGGLFLNLLVVSGPPSFAGVLAMAVVAIATTASFRWRPPARPDSIVGELSLREWADLDLCGYPPHEAAAGLWAAAGKESSRAASIVTAGCLVILPFLLLANYMGPLPVGIIRFESFVLASMAAFEVQGPRATDSRLLRAHGFLLADMTQVLRGPRINPRTRLASLALPAILILALGIAVSIYFPEPLVPIAGLAMGFLATSIRPALSPWRRELNFDDFANDIRLVMERARQFVHGDGDLHPPLPSHRLQDLAQMGR